MANFIIRESILGKYDVYKIVFRFYKEPKYKILYFLSFKYLGYNIKYQNKELFYKRFETLAKAKKYVNDQIEIVKWKI